MITANVAFEEHSNLSCPGSELTLELQLQWKGCVTLSRDPLEDRANGSINCETIVWIHYWFHNVCGMWIHVLEASPPLRSSICFKVSLLRGNRETINLQIISAHTACFKTDRRSTRELSRKPPLPVLVSGWELWPPPPAWHCREWRVFMKDTVN